MFQGHNVLVVLQTPTTLAELLLYAEKKGTNQIILSTQATVSMLINSLTASTLAVEPKINNYAGSLVKKTFKGKEFEFLIIPPLDQIYNVSYGKFLFKHYLSKFISPEKWAHNSSFSFKTWTDLNPEKILKDWEQAFAIAVDIETLPAATDNGFPLIDIVGYTAVFVDGPVWRTESIVVELRNMDQYAFIKALNALSSPKIFQNGNYDNAYLLAYDLTIHNYRYDTMNMMHALYAELPKDLGFLAAFFVRETLYWKDLSKSNDRYEQLLYNARDTWATANAAMAWLMSAPAYALKNYSLSFPINFPCLYSNMTGIAFSEAICSRTREAQFQKQYELERSLNKMTASSFNTASPNHKKALLVALGCADIAAQSTDAKSLAKAAYRSALNARIINKILEVQKLKKQISTYLTKNQGFRGKAMYSLNACGTDTGRLSSGENAFYTGKNIQNTPRGPVVKQCYLSSTKDINEWDTWESDLEQAESRDTAFISGDERLIAAVSGTRDFHSVNCSAFFGVPYEQIYDDEKKETLDKTLRDLAKRVNHGANYNMGPPTLVDTMGLEYIYKAKRLLKLPKTWGPIQIAEYLLEQFHKTYPDIAGKYYVAVKASIRKTQMLVGATGWTRYCFGNPEKSKLDLNAYVAHGPQSLNAMVLNMAYWDVFIHVALPNAGKFRLYAQIHDSIKFGTRKGYSHLAIEVKNRMEIPIEVTCVQGKTRTLKVPAALKGPAKAWSELK